MTTKSSNRSWSTVVEIRAPLEQTSDEFLDAARAALNVWGGMSLSTTRDADLNISIEFDPQKADGGIAGVVAWMNSLGVEYELRLHRWFDDD